MPSGIDVDQVVGAGHGEDCVGAEDVDREPVGQRAVPRREDDPGHPLPEPLEQTNRPVKVHRGVGHQPVGLGVADAAKTFDGTPPISTLGGAQTG